MLIPNPYKDLLLEEASRAAAKLTTMNPAEEAYSVCLHNLLDLQYQAYCVLDDVEKATTITAPAADPVPDPVPDCTGGPVMPEIPVTTPKKAEPVAEDVPATPAPVPEPTPITDPIPPVEETKRVWTKAEVRTELIALGNAGVDVGAVLNGLGYTRLSDVPADKYGELMEAAQKAVQ